MEATSRFPVHGAISAGRRETLECVLQGTPEFTHPSLRSISSITVMDEMPTYLGPETRGFELSGEVGIKSDELDSILGIQESRSSRGGHALDATNGYELSSGKERFFGKGHVPSWAERGAGERVVSSPDLYLSELRHLKNQFEPEYGDEWFNKLQSIDKKRALNWELRKLGKRQPRLGQAGAKHSANQARSRLLLAPSPQAH